MTTCTCKTQFWGYIPSKSTHSDPNLPLGPRFSPTSHTPIPTILGSNKFSAPHLAHAKKSRNFANPFPRYLRKTCFETMFFNMLRCSLFWKTFACGGLIDNQGFFVNPTPTNTAGEVKKLSWKPPRGLKILKFVTMNIFVEENKNFRLSHANEVARSDAEWAVLKNQC